MIEICTNCQTPSPPFQTSPITSETLSCHKQPRKVVIPGLFVRFASKIDEALQPQNLSYFSVATAAYAVGLLTCFGVNEITHAGQPALLYLDPSLVGSALACAVANDQLEEVWNFREAEEEAGKEE